jgi:hypothetical protein
MHHLQQMNEPSQNDFEKIAREQSDPGFVREFFGFLAANKKWWLLPIIAVLLLFGVLVLLSSTGLAPFIYTLF